MQPKEVTARPTDQKTKTERGNREIDRLENIEQKI